MTVYDAADSLARSNGPTRQLPVIKPRKDIDFGEFEDSLHLGAALTALAGLGFNLWLLFIHSGAQLFPSGYAWITGAAIAVPALVLVLWKFRSQKHATAMMVVMFCLGGLSWLIALSAWLAQPYMV